jgi:hypothetical protein
MAIFDIYSKRNQQGKEPDIFIYDEIPQRLRIQIHHIITGTFGSINSYSDEVNDVYQFIADVLKREWGVFSLTGKGLEVQYEVLQSLLHNTDVDRTLDIIQLSFQLINRYIRENINWKENHEAVSTPDEAIEELNYRFKENGVGYAFESDRIIRIDSTHIHSEVIKPALKLLSNPLFINANEEYLKAHEHYRHKRNKEALNECLKAFESVMKIICKQKSWQYDEKDTASKLIKCCIEKGLVPNYLTTELNSLKTLLESGIPPIRNNMGGHGQGNDKKEVPDHLAQYALNITGSNIIFLVQQSGLS